MKILYLDCFLGFETEMLLGALINIGADSSAIEAEMKKAFPSSALRVSNVTRCSVEALRAEVISDSVKAFKCGEAFEYIDSYICDTGASAYLKRIAGIYFDADSDAVLCEDELCRMYALYLALQHTGADYVICSSIREGSGFEEKDGGYYIIPSKAALEIVKTAKIPVRAAEIEKELTAACGAAVLAATANEYGAMPEMDIEKIGYGAGKEDLPMPNLMRAVLGTSRDSGLGSMFESTDLFSEFSDEISVLV